MSNHISLYTCGCNRTSTPIATPTYTYVCVYLVHTSAETRLELRRRGIHLCMFVPTCTCTCTCTLTPALTLTRAIKLLKGIRRTLFVQSDAAHHHRRCRCRQHCPLAEKGKANAHTQSVLLAIVTRTRKVACTNAYACVHEITSSHVQKHRDIDLLTCTRTPCVQTRTHACTKHTQAHAHTDTHKDHCNIHDNCYSCCHCSTF